ncbi:MAG: carboxypeptidase Taq [Parcubacteria group bacterium Gr01-1014_2]|nr:MAG: carboxypeptidase Taq [Parcubacteria group bacterium Gr01-1014_2]
MNFNEFKNKLIEIRRLQSAVALLNWDQQVYMPPEGVGERSRTIAALAGLIHQKFISKELESDLLILRKRQSRLTTKRKAVVREVWRDFSREKKLPQKFVEELARAASSGYSIWKEARKKSDFNLFVPQLKKIVNLKRKEAEYVGYKNSPYDALIDVYEPGVVSEEISAIFFELKSFLIPFIKKIKNSSVKIDPNCIMGNFDTKKQIDVFKSIIKKIGFDFEKGRLDETTHPFCTNFHPCDVRITTRFSKNDVMYCFSSVIHEMGHALYEQGILPENFGTPLGESVSLGIHESQSRLWEKIVGQSKHFWVYFYPLLKKNFQDPFVNVSLEEFYRIINLVKPSLIRTESDEVTYNLHIILRFEIEKELIEGSIDVADLPEIWNQKIEEYLGLKVKKDALGVLQDVHWSGGDFGYFPTYTLGNLYAAQFYAAAKNDIPGLEKKVSLGQFSPLLGWLRSKIHMHGKFYTAGDLVRNITGENLSTKYFVDYLAKKYKDIYKLKI